MALDFDACRYPRRVRTNLDYDLTVVSQPEPYDCGQVPGPEDLIHWRAAEMLHAPPGKTGRIDGMRARRHLSILTCAGMADSHAASVSAIYRRD
jgi:hypothetical protein